MNPGKKKPFSCPLTTFAPDQPSCSFKMVSRSTVWRSMKAIFPVSSTPMTPLSQISSSCKDFECTKVPTYTVFCISGASPTEQSPMTTSKRVAEENKAQEAETKHAKDEEQKPNKQSKRAKRREDGWYFYSLQAIWNWQPLSCSRQTAVHVRIGAAQLGLIGGMGFVRSRRLGQLRPAGGEGGETERSGTRQGLKSLSLGKTTHAVAKRKEFLGTHLRGASMLVWQEPRQRVRRLQLERMPASWCLDAAYLLSCLSAQWTRCAQGVWRQMFTRLRV